MALHIEQNKFNFNHYPFYETVIAFLTLMTQKKLTMNWQWLLLPTC